MIANLSFWFQQVSHSVFCCHVIRNDNTKQGLLGRLAAAQALSMLEGKFCKPSGRLSLEVVTVSKSLGGRVCFSESIA